MCMTVKFNVSEIRDNLWELFPDLIFLDEPVDDSLIHGLALIYDEGPEWVVAYDKRKLITKLTDYFHDEEQAWEWFEYNILGSYLGPATPVFIDNIQTQRFNAEYDCSDIFEIEHLNTLEEAFEVLEEYNDNMLLVPLDQVENIKLLA